MFHFTRLCRGAVILVATLFLGMAEGRAQISITGVADRTSYTDSAQFLVASNAGYLYTATLNGQPVPVGVNVRVTRMDYYELAVERLEIATDEVTNARVRFIVLSSNRGSPERGLIEWLPYPMIDSASAELAAAHLKLVLPQDYPSGLEIPVAARLENGQGGAIRANTTVVAPGQPSIRIRRGIGSGYLNPAAGGGPLAYAASVPGMVSNRIVNIEPSTTWTTVSGNLAGNVVWPENARIAVTGSVTIPAGSSLTVEEGAVVRLGAGVDIHVRGRLTINGTEERPVVFTPAVRAQPWGGVITTNAFPARIDATGAFFVGSGADPSWFGGTGYDTHLAEQACFILHDAVANFTNCFFLDGRGQVGHGDNSDLTMVRCIAQRFLTGGEYVGGTIIVDKSAFIEFPADDGIVNATIANADNDAIYFTTGTHILTDSLFGWCKDDAIDAGSGGAGTVVVSNCWVESALHEALAWSGSGRQTWTYNTVLINNGQGIECGWSGSANSPLCLGDGLLSLGNAVGARYGDNYEGTSGLGLKDGFLTVTNSYILHNYRDVWGLVWDNTWNYRVGDMDIRGNYLTAVNTNHPDNTVWNPAVHAAKLGPFLSSPLGAAVGLGFANWEPLTRSSLTSGVPVRLSTFTTNTVSVDYVVRTPSSTLASGTLTFLPGETVKPIIASITAVPAQDPILISLSNPIRAEVTTASRALLASGGGGAGTNLTLVSFNSAWKYLDDGSNQGTAWRAPGFNDNGWSNGLAQLGFGDNPADETTRLRRTNSTGTTNITFYFRKTFNVAAPSTFASLGLRLLRDDAGVVYLNGNEVFRNSNLPAFPAAIGYLTTASSTGENTIDTATLSPAGLVPGQNLVAVEIHQESITSSDISFDLELVGTSAPPPPRLNLVRFGGEYLLYWSDPSFRLEVSDQLDSAANWQTFGGGTSPALVELTGPQRFYRLKK